MEKEVLKMLKAWLNVPGNTKRILAKKMHYSSGSVISNWVDRNKIPHYRVEELNKFFTREAIKNVNARQSN